MNRMKPTKVREQMGAVPGYVWAAIPVVMAVAAVLPGGLAGCLHVARWIFGFPFPNCYRCGTFPHGTWVWNPAGILFNQLFWLIFLCALAVVSPRIAEKCKVGRGLFFFGAVLLLTLAYFAYYRGYAMLLAEHAF